MRLFSFWWKKQQDPPGVELLASPEDENFNKNSKKLVQRFDEYITAAELESENLSIELDEIINHQEIIRDKIKTLNKPNSWHERHLLLKLDRLILHGKNLEQRIEIFAQNIRVYLNLMGKVQHIRAMRMNGLEDEKIEHIWLEFQSALEQYRQKIATEGAADTKDTVTAETQEDRLKTLRLELFPDQSFETTESDVSEATIEPVALQRPPLEEAIHSFRKEEEQELLKDVEEYLGKYKLEAE